MRINCITAFYCDVFWQFLAHVASCAYMCIMSIMSHGCRPSTKSGKVRNTNFCGHKSFILFHFPGFKVQSASLGKEGKQEHSTADKDSSASCEQVSFNTCDNLFMVRSVTPHKSDKFKTFQLAQMDANRKSQKGRKDWHLKPQFSEFASMTQVNRFETCVNHP